MKNTLCIGIILFLGLLARAQTSLLDALARGDAAQARALVGSTVDVNVVNRDQHSAIYLALAQGDVKLAQLLFEHGAYIFHPYMKGDELALCKSNGAKHFLHEKMQEIRALEAALLRGDWKAAKALPDLTVLISQPGESYRWPLFCAAEFGDPAIVEKLIALGADVLSTGYRPGYPNLPIAVAIQGGHLDVVKALLQHGVSIEMAGVNRHTPLTYAITYRQPEIAAYLIGQGADLNVTTADQGFPLSLACLMRDRATLELLIAKGARVPAYESCRRTMIAAAASFGDKALFIRLMDVFHLDPKLPPNAKGREYGDPMKHCMYGESDSLLRYLVEELHYPIELPRGEGSPLVAAAVAGNLAAMRYLLDRGADITAIGADHQTALCAATSHDKPAAVKLLLSRGALTQPPGDAGKALKLATLANAYDVAVALVQAGVDPSYGLQEQPQNDSTLNYLKGCTSLTEEISAALIAADHARVQQLLDGGAPLGASNANGDSPLSIAVQQGDVACVKLLLQRGASPNFIDRNGHLPLALAASMPQNQAMIQALVAGGARLDYSGFPGASFPLNWAIGKGYLSNAVALLDLGADPNAMTNSGPALFDAARKQDLVAVKLLLDRGADPRLRDGGGRNVLFFGMGSDSMFTWLSALPQLSLQVTDDNGRNLLEYFPATGSMATLRALTDVGLRPKILYGNGGSFVQQQYKHPLRIEMLAHFANLGMDFDQLRYGQQRFYSYCYREDRAGLMALIDSHQVRFPVMADDPTGSFFSMLIRARDLQAIDLWMRRGGNINEVDAHGLTPLMNAYLVTGTDANDTLMRLILKYQPDLNIPSGYGFTVLMLAMEYGDEKRVRSWVAQGADPKAVDRFGNTVLMHYHSRLQPRLRAEPAPAPNLGLIKWLVALGADPMRRDSSGFQLLHLGARLNDSLLVQYALEELHLPIGECVNYGLSALGLCLESVTDSELFMSGGHALDDAEYQAQLARFRSRLQPRLPLVRYLIRAGVPLNAKTEFMGDAIIDLYVGGELDLVKEAIGLGYDLNRVAAGYNTLLFQAVRRNDHAFVRYLLQKGADPAANQRAVGDMIYQAKDEEMRKLLGK
jgi:ankyrin repeat protein